jgi:homoserine kinase
MITRKVKVFAPASVSNLGSGFDVLGVAIDRPGDFVVASRQERPGLLFSLDSKSHDVPGQAEQNVAAHVALLMLEELKPPFGVRMTLHKRMPIGSGLGSSAASSVASAVGVNALLTKPLKKKDLLRFVVEGERMASGSPHADNVAPSLLGGVCLIRSYEPLDVESIPIRNRIVWVAVHPHLFVRTEEARNVLPETVSLKSAIRQWGNVGGLVAGLLTGNATLVGKCVEDVIVEPARAHLVPGFYEVKKAALDAGAFGCSLSGSGPSMFAVAPSQTQARVIAQTMVKTFARVAQVKCDVYISRTNMAGATILSSTS